MWTSISHLAGSRNTPGRFMLMGSESTMQRSLYLTSHDGFYISDSVLSFVIMRRNCRTFFFVFLYFSPSFLFSYVYRYNRCRPIPSLTAYLSQSKSDFRDLPIPASDFSRVISVRAGLHSGPNTISYFSLIHACSGEI